MPSPDPASSSEVNVAENGQRPLPARLAGGIWGHLVGDALGVPYEFRSASAIGEVTWRGEGAHGQPPGTWSDDGALMLALLDSLLDVGFDPADQGRRAVRWWRSGAYAPGGTVFDIGNATSHALRSWRTASRRRRPASPAKRWGTDR